MQTKVLSLRGTAIQHRCTVKTSIATRSKLHRSVSCMASAGSNMNVLVIGSGGREHALAWKMAQSPSCNQLFVAPGNAGTELEPNMITMPSLNPSNHKAVIDFCKEKQVGFVVVGPEQPLVEGLVDSLSAAGITAFGPSAAAAQLEGSKAFMKNILRKYNIPTAFYEVFDNPTDAKAYIKAHGAPIVVKTSGLAAGKGVIVAQTEEEAFAAVDDMLIKGTFGNAGERIVIEEFLDGEEASFFALIDGETCIPLVGAQDHKAVGDGDTGPNTGGMGSYSPAPVLTPELQEQVMRDLIYPTARGMAAEGTPFRGVLFAGLMIDSSGKAKLLEHNVRFGDPECQSLMVRLRSDLLDTLQGALRGEAIPLEWDPSPSLTVVLAAKGYPGSYGKGAPINGLESVTGAKVFHAGTAMKDGQVVSAGGRVLGVTALGKDVAEAQAKAYAAVDQIDFADGFCRRDIGWRAVARLREGK
jgi:phosphoribosylamine--glycine ligase